MSFQCTEECIRYLFCEDAEIHTAAYCGDTKGIRRILQNGTDVNIVDKGRATPLRLASMMVNNQTHTIKEILKHKPQMNSRDDNHQTPLHILVTHPRYDMQLLEWYLNDGADPNSADSYGRTPLHNIVIFPLWDICTWLRCIKLMISHKADFNLTDEDGNTALHLAAMCELVEVVDLLLEHGAKTNIKNRDGYTPIDIAFTCSDTDVLDSLGKHFLMQYSLNMEVNEDNVKRILEMELFEDFWKQCNTELEQLKEDKIGDTEYSYFDMMTLPTQRMSKIFRNEETQTSVIYYDTEIFEIYGEHLCNCLYRAIERNSYATIGTEFCYRMWPWMPEIIIDEITSFLSNEEMSNFAEVINMDTSHLIIDYLEQCNRCFCS